MSENKRFELVDFQDNIWWVNYNTGQITNENSNFTLIWKELVVDLLNEQDSKIHQFQKRYDRQSRIIQKLWSIIKNKDNDKKQKKLKNY